MVELRIESREKIKKVAREFIKLTGKSKIFAFYGDLGAGKTTFIKAVCSELGVTDSVSSPSFALIYEYRTITDEIIYHIDLYRIKDISELFDLGYEDYFYSGNRCFIEWPEKAGNLLPEDCVKINISVTPEGTRILNIS